MSEVLNRNIVLLMLCLAPGAAHALDWERLWLNDDQRAAARMAQRDYAAAARTFQDRRWQAAAWYRAGEYRRAADAWAEFDDVDGHYNRGNALARAGDVAAAVEAYEAVLQRQPGHADARHNLEVLRELMQKPSDPDSAQREARPDTFRDEVMLPPELRELERFPPGDSLPVVPAFVAFGALGPPSTEVPPAGLIFWGVFFVFGLVVLLYLLWMRRTERSEPEP